MGQRWPHETRDKYFKKRGTFWVWQCRVWPWPSAAAQSWGGSDTGRRCTGCKCTCSAAGRGWRDTRETHQHIFITPDPIFVPPLWEFLMKWDHNLTNNTTDLLLSFSVMVLILFYFILFYFIMLHFILKVCGNIFSEDLVYFGGLLYACHATKNHF